MWPTSIKRLFTTTRYLNSSFHEKVALIRLNRPSALNSLNSELMKELRETLSEMEKEESLTSVVLTGDIKAFAGNFI